MAGHPRTGALVWRLDTAGPVQIAAARPKESFAPASTMKIVTAANALAALGPGARFETRLVAGANSHRNGATLIGPLYIKGYGDPVLATPKFARAELHGLGGSLGKLVAPLRQLGITRVLGPIVSDEGYLDNTRGGPLWEASYRFESPPLSALSINQNFNADDRSHGYVKNSPLAAADRVRGTMHALGIAHVGPLRVGVSPVAGRPIGSVMSPPLSRIVGLMLPPSDNFIAETITRDVGARVGGSGTTAAGTAQATKFLTQLGALRSTDRIVDGSGLSRANRLSAETLVRVLAAADEDVTWGAPLVRALPHGGEGTLKRRLKSPAVASHVSAKTGSIDGVTSLAGLVTSDGGIRYAFAFLMNGRQSRAAHRAQDQMVTLLATGAADFAAGAPAYSPASVPPPPNR